MPRLWGNPEIIGFDPWLLEYEIGDVIRFGVCSGLWAVREISREKGLSLTCLRRPPRYVTAGELGRAAGFEWDSEVDITSHTLPPASPARGLSSN